MAVNVDISNFRPNYTYANDMMQKASTGSLASGVNTSSGTSNSSVSTIGLSQSVVKVNADSSSISSQDATNRNFKFQNMELREALKDLNQLNAMKQVAMEAGTEQMNTLKSMELLAFESAQANITTDMFAQSKTELNTFLQNYDAIAQNATFNGNPVFSDSGTNIIGLNSDSSLLMAIKSTLSDAIGNVGVQTGNEINSSLNLEDISFTVNGETFSLGDFSLNAQEGQGLGALAEAINAISSDTGITATASVSQSSSVALPSIDDIQNISINGMDLEEIFAGQEGLLNDLVNYSTAYSLGSRSSTASLDDWGSVVGESQTTVSQTDLALSNGGNLLYDLPALQEGDILNLQIQNTLNNSNSRFDSGFGMYFEDVEGNPLSGKMIFESTQNMSEGDMETLAISTSDIPDGAVRIGFFMAGNINDDNQQISDGMSVEFQEFGKNGNFFRLEDADGNRLDLDSVADSVYFSNPENNIGRNGSFLSVYLSGSQQANGDWHFQDKLMNFRDDFGIRVEEASVTRVEEMNNQSLSFNSGDVTISAFRGDTQVAVGLSSGDINSHEGVGIGVDASGTGRDMDAGQIELGETLVVEFANGANGAEIGLSGLGTNFSDGSIAGAEANYIAYRGDEVVASGAVGQGDGDNPNVNSITIDTAFDRIEFTTSSPTDINSNFSIQYIETGLNNEAAANALVEGINANSDTLGISANLTNGSLIFESTNGNAMQIEGLSGIQSEYYGQLSLTIAAPGETKIEGLEALGFDNGVRRTEANLSTVLELFNSPDGARTVANISRVAQQDLASTMESNMALFDKNIAALEANIDALISQNASTESGQRPRDPAISEIFNNAEPNYSAEEVKQRLFGEKQSFFAAQAGSEGGTIQQASVQNLLSLLS